jgi:O-antigen/teichoic acid export membrane protein
MSGARKVVRNSLFGVAGEAVGGAMSFLIVILIARDLGADTFGLFAFVLALTSIFQLVADFGLTNIIVKEISRAKSDTVKVISAVKPLVWLFTLVILLVLLAVGYPLAKTQEVFYAIVVMGAAVLITFHAVVYGSVCRAHEDMGYNAIAFVSHKFVLLAAVLLALDQKLGIVGVAGAYLIANMYQWAYFYWVFRKRYVDGPVRWRVDYPYWRYLIHEAFPVGIAMVFRRANLHTGTLILTAMSSASAVGIFNAAYRVIQMVDMIPFTLSIPLFPPFTRMATESRERLFEVLERVMGIFMVLAAPLFTLSLLLADRIIVTMFGDAYLDGVTTLAVLSGAVLFLFPTGLFVYLFTAMGHQRFYTVSSGICLIINIVACVSLIPLFGHLGAAMATLAAEVAFFISGMVFLHKLGFKPHFFRVFIKPVLVAVLAGLWIKFLPDWSMPLVMLAVAALGYGLLYLPLVLLTGLVNKNDLGLIMASVKPKAARNGGAA